MTSNPILNPFCEICGKYKGIGFCKDSKCKGHEQDKSTNNENTLRSSFVSKNWCSICGNSSISYCTSCNQGFCEKHAIGLENSRLIHKEQHIGTCVECGKYVCENCWILDDTGAIICLDHLENREQTTKE
jgi:hypothetical protein